MQGVRHFSVDCFRLRYLSIPFVYVSLILYSAVVNLVTAGFNIQILYIAHKGCTDLRPTAIISLLIFIFEI